MAIAAGAGEGDAGADRREEEGAALPGVGVLDLDDRTDADRRGAGERGWAKLHQAIDLGERLLGALLLGAAEAGELVCRAGVFALLVGGRAVARLGGGGIAGRQRGAGGGLELADELVD